jgi:hypothetical protein
MIKCLRYFGREKSTKILDDRYCSGVKTPLWCYYDSSAGTVDLKFVGTV